MRDACSRPLWIAWIGPGEYFSAHWTSAGTRPERSISLEYSHAGHGTPDIRRYVDEVMTDGSTARKSADSEDTDEAQHIRLSSIGSGETFCTVHGEIIASNRREQAVTAFGLCNEAGLLVCIGIPNPLLTGAALEAGEARSVVTIEFDEAAARVARSFFADQQSARLELKELILATASRYRIDRYGRLRPKPA